MEFGLIGYPLKHSFSKYVHSLFSSYTYDICELEEKNFNAFMKNKNFKGINVTIPYKQKVIPYISEVDTFAKDINAVNTIINNNGILKGYNTDFYGLIATFNHFKCFNKEHTYIIFGTGATSNTIKYSLRYLGATKIKKCYRKDSKIKGDILYEDLLKEYENESIFIINATPNGMYPHSNDNLLIDINKFKNIKGVIDLIYNPLKSNLLIEAKKLNIPTFSGLYMLVAQALFAYKYFTNNNFSTEDILNNTSIMNEIQKYYEKCLKSKLNIVITGMPTCGKSTIGKLISEKYQYEFIDTDKLIEDRINTSIADFIKNNGEEKFREIESLIIKEISTKNHSVISTGGGAILKNENVTNLKHNGKIFFINRSLNLLKPSVDRPLTSNKDDLKKKFDERLPIYKKTCDVEINGDMDFNERILEIFSNL